MQPRIAYLYSRYPVVSQTFCDSEMLALEALGFSLEVVALNRPIDSFRHERLDRLKAECHYPAPAAVIQAEAKQLEFETQLGELVRLHDERYGKEFKALTRAKNAWHIAKRLRVLGVEHVHVHFANRATHTALFLKRLGFRFSFTAHAQDFMVDLGSDALLDEMIREAEFVVTVSDFSRQLILQQCPGHDAKVLRIYNGIELDDFGQEDRSQQGPLRLISVGRLIEFKGFQHLIESVQLLRQRGVAVQARIIGDGPLRAELQQRIDELGLQQQVQLLGVQSQEVIKRELARAQVFVLPAIVDRKGASDILPTVITEAMAARLPVVSTYVAGIPEMVKHEETGLLVPAKDEVALADALDRLSQLPDLRVTMGEAGRRWAETHFHLNQGVGGGTAQLLAQEFAKLKPQQEAKKRLQASRVYLADEAQLANLIELRDQHDLRILVSSAMQKPAWLGDNVEYFPDTVVLESLWLRRVSWRQKLEKARMQLGDQLPSEVFYLHAKRACWLVETLSKRGVTHLHACRSEQLLTAWLCAQLMQLKLSACIEEDSVWPLSVLRRCLEIVKQASVSLPALQKPGFEEVMPLTKATPTKEHRILGWSFRKTKDLMPSRLPSFEKQWFQQLLKSDHE